MLVKYPIREKLATYRSTVTWNRGQVFKLTYRRRPANPIRLGVIMMSPSPPSPSRSLLVLLESGHGGTVTVTVTETTPSRRSR